MGWWTEPVYRAFKCSCFNRKVMTTLHRSLLMVLLCGLAPFAGCLTSSSEPSALEDPPEVETVSCDGPDYPEWNLSCAFPSFNLTDDTGVAHNLSSSNGTGRWVAYLSAYWCTHCKPTLDALDVAVPDGQLLVFNKDDSDDNMTAWKDHMEDELNRTINRPFIHAPWLGSAMQVQGIPHVVLVENGTVLAVRIGLWDDPESIQAWMGAESPVSGYSAQLD